MPQGNISASGYWLWRKLLEINIFVAVVVQISIPVTILIFLCSSLSTILRALLPLNRSRRLRRDVIDDAIDAADLVDDARRGARQEIVVEMIAIRRHAVG